ncbi:MAG: hypothetical protein DRP57_12010 [Spirochaetes bacterium]|nr:MAG: hypothetical protein DRP57_12010 [Spirochaetota bacterium]
MQSFNISTLKPGTYFDAPVYLDKEYIILSPDTPLSKEIIRRLKKWGFTQLLSEGKQVDAPTYSSTDNGTPSTSILEENIQESEKIQTARKFYYEYIDFTRTVIKIFLSENHLNIPVITEKIKQLIDMEKNNRDYLLRYTELEIPVDNYLIIHSSNTSILSITLGSFLKLPPHRLIELGLSSLLHDIGMFKLPERLYNNKTKLTEKDQKTVMAHTILGYRILKGFSVPENVALGALEHHERMDGTGYPKRISGSKISIYARIIAVACSFDAMLTPRPYKESFDGHRAMLDLLRGNKAKYDENVIRALIYRLSIYPLGTYILLSNNAKGLVVKTEINNPRFPAVRILKDENGKKPEKPLIIATSEESGLFIKRSLTKEEIKNL